MFVQMRGFFNFLKAHSSGRFLKGIIPTIFIHSFLLSLVFNMLSAYEKLIHIHNYIHDNIYSYAYVLFSLFDQVSNNAAHMSRTTSSS